MQAVSVKPKDDSFVIVTIKHEKMSRTGNILIKSKNKQKLT